ncbi:MAG TPA: FAD-binding protein, partial [Chthoniobacteraceae bacterium]|nr:FAD-binding protein [Chthoniobacteraceae bacterium]
MTLAALSDAIRSVPRLLAVGARTKPRLSEIDASTTLISTRCLSGIIEYDPGEFTFTALAGTRLDEIMSALAEKGQYLPFDPMLVQAGATLGGTVASGLSGPGRFRFGGIRDFILGVRFVDGTGRVLRLGGKVVKNAAGFDLPKFFVGSLGRFGVLAEITFKVFPRPAHTLTLQLEVNGVADAARLFGEISKGRWEPDALDLLPNERAIVLRLAGPEPALAEIAREILAQYRGVALTAADAATLWRTLCEFGWADPDSAIIKVVTIGSQLPSLSAALESERARMHVSAGGDVAYIAAADGAAIAAKLNELNLRGLLLRG